MNIDIITSNGVSIELVRFFQFNDKKYLIFQENESTDEGGYITIRISEVEQANKVIANAIDDADWENVKNIIKNIVNLNKNNQTLNIDDLDYNLLEGIEIVGYKSLKLMKNYIELLKVNQTIFEKSIGDNIVDSSSKIFNETNSVDSNNAESLNAGLDIFNMNIINQQNLEPEKNIENDITNDYNNELNQNNVENSENIDYQSLYIEQLKIVEELQLEIQMYQNKLETLKSIING